MDERGDVDERGRTELGLRSKTKGQNRKGLNRAECDRKACAGCSGSSSLFSHSQQNILLGDTEYLKTTCCFYCKKRKEDGNSNKQAVCRS